MAAEHFQAEFVDTASSPASVLRVKIPGFDNGVGSFVVVWSPAGNALPAAGDQALVVESDDGTWWAVAWESAAQSTILVPKVFTVVGQSLVDLGTFDGDNITGVRITAHVVVIAPGGSIPFFLKINGLSTVNTNQVAQRQWWPFGGPSQTDLQEGANVAARAGVQISRTDWVNTGNTACTFTGTFFTKALGNFGRRHWNGLFTTQDLQTNQANMLGGQIISEWDDTTTAVTSLGIAIPGGTFTGRLVVETLP